jgi:hypothetical protein
MSTGAENVTRLGRRLLRTDLHPDERSFVESSHTRLDEIVDVVAGHRIALDDLWRRLQEIDPQP